MNKTEFYQKYRELRDLEERIPRAKSEEERHGCIEGATNLHAELTDHISVICDCYWLSTVLEEILRSGVTSFYIGQIKANTNAKTFLEHLSTIEELDRQMYYHQMHYIWSVKSVDGQGHTSSAHYFADSQLSAKWDGLWLDTDHQMQDGTSLIPHELIYGPQFLIDHAEDSGLIEISIGD